MRVRNNRLHCQNCYSNDEGKTFTFSPTRKTFTFTVNPFRVEVQQSVIATEDKKIYTRLQLYQALPELHLEQAELDGEAGIAVEQAGCSIRQIGIQLHQDLTSKHKSFNLPPRQTLVSLSIIYSVSTILSVANGSLIFKNTA